MKHDPDILRHGTDPQWTVDQLRRAEGNTLPRPSQHVHPATMERWGRSLDDDLDDGIGWVWDALRYGLAVLALLVGMALAVWVAL